MKNDESLVIMNIQIWKDKYNDGLYNYKNDNSKREDFHFDLNIKNCFFIQTKYNKIKWIKDHK